MKSQIVQALFWRKQIFHNEWVIGHYDFKLKHAGQVIFSIYRKIQGSVFFTLLGLQRSKSSLFKNYTFMGKVVVLFFFSIFFKAIKLFLTHKFQQNLILNFSTSLNQGNNLKLVFAVKIMNLTHVHVFPFLISHAISLPIVFLYFHFSGFRWVGVGVRIIFQFSILSSELIQEGSGHKTFQHLKFWHCWFSSAPSSDRPGP